MAGVSQGNEKGNVKDIRCSAIDCLTNDFMTNMNNDP